MPNSPWVDMAQGFMPSIMGKDLLEPRGRLTEGDRMLNGILLSSLAAAGYKIKNGQSVVLEIPPCGPNALVGVVDYVHATRIDALQGLVRASWYQPSTMAVANDLVVWTRYVKQKARVSRVDDSHTIVVGKLRERELIKNELEGTKHLAHTVLCQQSPFIRSLCETLRAELSPFAVIIDATPWGCRDNLVELIQLLEEYFPCTPRLILTARGDKSTLKDIVRAQGGENIWQMGLTDQVLFGSKMAREWKGRVVLVPDRRLNDRLTAIYRQIKLLESELPSPDLKEKGRPLLNVWHKLVSMPVPLSYFKAYADQERRGGFYPIRPLCEVIVKMAGERMPTGNAEMYKETICNQFNDLFDYLETGRTGKEQGVLKWLDETLKKNARGIIALPSAREASVLHRYLLQERYEAIESNKIQIIGASTVNDLYSITGEPSRLLLLGLPWWSDYWVGGLVVDFTWIAYPIEQKLIESRSLEITRSCHTDDTDKAYWWKHLNPPVDLDAHPLEIVEWGDCSGQYEDQHEFVIEPDFNENWAMDLVADLEWKEKADDAARFTHGSEKVKIFTGDMTLYFDRDERVDVMRTANKEKTPRMSASDIEEGDIILLLHSNDEDSTLLDTVMEALDQGINGLRALQDMVAGWQPMVLKALENNGNDFDKLHKNLAATKVSRDRLENWAMGKNVIRNDKDVIIPAMAKAARDYDDRRTPIFRNAIRDLEGARLTAGKELAKIKRATALADGEIDIAIGSQKLPSETITESIMFVEVVSIEVPDDPPPDQQEEEWMDRVVRLAQESEGKVQISSAALRSMQQCQYKDGARIIRCFELIRDALHPVYFGAQKNKIGGAIETLKKEGIEFKGGTSEVTQGKRKADYKSRQWKNRRADLSRHLAIGGSRSKERCFRLHFDTDEEDQSVVVHHAGGHLRTSRD